MQSQEHSYHFSLRDSYISGHYRNGYGNVTWNEI